MYCSTSACENTHIHSHVLIAATLLQHWDLQECDMVLYHGTSLEYCERCNTVLLAIIGSIDLDLNKSKSNLTWDHR